MAFEHIIGQERAVAVARAWLRRGRVPHAVLLCGPEGSGKRFFALELARSLLCGAAESGGACGRCPACRRATSLSHPDLHVLLPLPPRRGRKEHGPGEVRAAAIEYVRGGDLSGQGNISIEQLRALQRQMSLAPVEAGRKVGVLLAAERMHPAGAHSLLKMLEEPAPTALFILVSAAPERLLPTVSSRCQRLPLRALGLDVLRQHLRAEGVEGERLEVAVRLAGGSLARARQVAAGAWDEVRRQVEAFIAAGVRRDDGAYWQVLEELGNDRARQEVFLQVCAFYLRDLFLALHQGEEGAVLVDRRPLLAQWRSGVDAALLERTLLELERAAESLTRNSQMQLALVDVWRCLRRAAPPAAAP